MTGVYLCRQRPTLPHTFACSTIGPAELNLRRLEGVSARPLRAGAFCRNPERSLRRILTSVFGRKAARLRRKVDLRVAAGCRGSDGFHNQGNVWPKTGPLLQAKNHNRNFAAHKVLLMAHVLVGGQQHIEATRFCGRKQFAILERVPPLLRRGSDLVSFEMGANRYWRRLIEQDPHVGILREPRERRRVLCRDCGLRTRSRLLLVRDQDRHTIAGCRRGWLPLRGSRRWRKPASVYPSTPKRRSPCRERSPPPNTATNQDAPWLRSSSASIALHAKKEKANLISQTGLYLMPATTYSPTHFRVQYNRPCGGLT